MSREDHLGDCRIPESDPGAVRNTYDWENTPPSAAVIRTVAVAANDDPTSMEPLFDRIDPDALDTLLRESSTDPSTDDVEISFRFNGHTVQVDGQGEVVVGGRL